MDENSRKRVLVVEDDPIHRKVLAALVNQSRLDATYTEDGIEALEQIRKNDFDALILDLNLPRLDGIALIEELKRTAPELVRRVVVISGLGEEHLTKAAENEICGVLRKPIDLTEFQRVLAECVAARDRSA